MTLRVISENKIALSATLLYKVTAFGFVGSIRFFPALLLLLTANVISG